MALRPGRVRERNGWPVSLGDRIVATLPRRALNDPSVHQQALDEADLTHVKANRYLRALAKRLNPEELIEFLMGKCYGTSPGNARVYYPPTAPGFPSEEDPLAPTQEP